MVNIAKPEILIIRAPGTNCDFETALAFEQAGAVTRLAHINELINRSVLLADYQVLVFPGGFTYGDDLGAGRIMGNEIRLNLGDDIRAFITWGGLILGICNGFQVMVQSGILPGNGKRVTLTGNDSGRFECRWIHLNANQKSNCVFTRGIARLYLPVANGEGKLVAETDILSGLNVALYYCDKNGNQTSQYPDNPSGSLNDIAGLSDHTGRIFALMPHPERHIRANQHPRWTRGEASRPGDGLKIFTNAVDWVRHL
jgi:phosphoribosylformylglycinamidine synthase